MKPLLNHSLALIAISAFMSCDFPRPQSGSVNNSTETYALDDSHNHDESHTKSSKNCGTNYLTPKSIARMGSHSFLILGQDGPEHLWAEHRSGTPPHNYQYILRVHVTAEEMAFYHKMKAESKRPPAFTTIYYDDQNSAEQLDRTFFCLHDLPKIFGAQQKKNDRFSSLFPIKASLQKDADFEGAFDIAKSIYPGGHFEFDRDEVEIILYRYLPTYLDQEALRQEIKNDPTALLAKRLDAPTSYKPSTKKAQRSASFALTDAKNFKETKYCASDYHLKKSKPLRTTHSFVIVGAIDKGTLLLSHLYDQSPQNFQSILKLTVSSEEMAAVKKMMDESSTPLLLQSQVISKEGITQEITAFCMADLKELLRNRHMSFTGTVFSNTQYSPYRRGAVSGELRVESEHLEVVTNRYLPSLLDIDEVAQDELGQEEYLKARAQTQRGALVDLNRLAPHLTVHLSYFTDKNFLGRRVKGYLANRCWLTPEAAHSLVRVEKDLNEKGYTLIVFDCYRPQQAVADFVSWSKDLKDQKTKSAYYPELKKEELFAKGYIATQSGHSRGSTVDLTIASIGQLRAPHFNQALKQSFDYQDCRDFTSKVQINMGTAYDCFDPKANTDSQLATKSDRKNREILKGAMEKQGFENYDKEWWHFTLKQEPFPTTYFDFVVD